MSDEPLYCRLCGVEIGPDHTRECDDDNHALPSTHCQWCGSGEPLRRDVRGCTGLCSPCFDIAERERAHQRAHPRTDNDPKKFFDV